MPPTVARCRSFARALPEAGGQPDEPVAAIGVEGAEDEAAAVGLAVAQPLGDRGQRRVGLLVVRAAERVGALAQGGEAQRPEGPRRRRA
jgi:hypothetical protein